MIVLPALSAFWFGILTAISPCPMATNIAAVSFIGRRVDSPRRAFAAGVAYAVGRSLAYVLLAVVLVSALLSTPQVSHFLQKYMSKLLGPLIILVGMLLLELIRVPGVGFMVSDRWQRRAAAFGAVGALALGFVFALSFCPLSATLYFGSLLPLAIGQESRFLLPALYGLGTSLPVLAFGVIIALGARSLARWFNRLSHCERWARLATGAVFLLVGLYLTVANTFGWFSGA